MLFVPGGVETVAAMKDEAIVAFFAERGRDARYVTSVCAGSLLLGMPGCSTATAPRPTGRRTRSWRRSASRRATTGWLSTAIASLAAASPRGSTSG